MHSSELVVAFADPSVAVVQLGNGITLQESDVEVKWDFPLVLNRSLTITTVPTHASAALLDLNLISKKVQLGRSGVLRLERVVVANYASGLWRLGARIDLLVPSPEPLPGVPRPAVVLYNSALMYPVCFSDRIQVIANQALLRPPEAPGHQSYLGAVAQPGCVNSSAAPPMERCWAGRYKYSDWVIEANFLDEVGNALPANYVLREVNGTSLCRSIVDDACVARSGPLACWTLTMERVAGELRQEKLEEQQRQEEEEEQQQRQADAQSASGHDSTAALLYTVLPAVLGGLAVLALALAVAYKWRMGILERRRVNDYGDTDTGLPKSAAATWGGNTLEGCTETGTLPYMAAEVVLEVEHKPYMMAAGSSSGGGTRSTTEASSSAPLPVGTRVELVTPTSPQWPHVRLDLRLGADVTVDAAAMRGAGAFGRVMEGDCNGQRVAVKLLHTTAMHAGNARAQAALEALHQEVQVLSRCSHRHVVQLLGACLQPPNVCLVMELMDQSLEQLMDHHTRLLPLDQVLSIARDIASGLAYLHPTVVHRDLKPANVLLDAQGAAKLGDFGLSRLRSTVVVTRHPQAGTVPYTAPECFLHNAISHKADIYSFGVVLWEMLAGQAPWRGMPQLAIVMTINTFGRRLPLWSLGPARCPQRLRELLEECWDADPQRRPSAEEVVKRLVVIEQQLSRQRSATMTPAAAVRRPLGRVKLPAFLAAAGELLGSATAVRQPGSAAAAGAAAQQQQQRQHHQQLQQPLSVEDVCTPAAGRPVGVEAACLERGAITQDTSTGICSDFT